MLIFFADTIDKTKVSFAPPVKPKGGEVYIYSHGGSKTKKGIT